MEIGVLGSIVVVADGGPVPLRSGPQRLLLAMLVAADGRVVSPDELVEALWHDALPADPVAALQSQVSRLRRALGPAAAWLRTEGAAGYRLAGGPDRVDAARFAGLLTRAGAANAPPAEALRDVDAALGLWRGRAYLEVADHEAVRIEATALQEQHADATELRAELLLALDRAGEAARAMQALASAHPFRERPVELLMRALAADGRHAEALQAYEDFRRVLADELGLDPSPELRAVQAEVLAPGPGAGAAVALPGDSFVGRDTDLDSVVDALARSRLVTLTGPGGMGKTRLALHTAAAVADRYPDGIRICELAAVTEADGVAEAMASTLGVKERAGQSVTDRVVEFLASKRTLLVVDNCEHVLGGAAALVAAVLARVPGADVLATSRMRLGLGGERRMPLDPLPTPVGDDASAPAVVLFIDRARAARPGLRAGGADLTAICELCRRLDGLPLAIELAAARTAARTPAEIVAELGDRLARLADRRRPDGRHRSIEAAVGWSFDLLSPEEREVAERLAVFPAGFAAEAAAAVAGCDPYDLIDHLTSMVEHSLLRVRDAGAPGAGRSRYSMLEPVRQYAEARLADAGDLPGARARHAAWFLAWAEEAAIGLRGPDEGRWVADLTEELAGLRAAHSWLLEHDPDGAVRLAGALYRFAYFHGPAEIFHWAEQTTRRHGKGGHRGLAEAYATAAVGAWRRGDLAGARARARLGIEAAPPGEEFRARFAWDALGDAEIFAGDLAAAVSCWQRSLTGHQDAGDLAGVVSSLFGSNLALAYGGDVDTARAAMAAATPLVAAANNPTARAMSDYMQGEIRLETAPEEALVLLRRAVVTARQAGNRFIAGVAGLSEVSCAARHGDPAESLGHYAELIEHWQRAGEWTQQWATLRTLIETLTRLGRHPQAAVLHGALGATGSAAPLIGLDAERMAAADAAFRAALGERRAAALSAEGAALGDDGAVAYALRCVPRPGAPSARRRRTFMFTDIVSSTDLIEALGDEAWDRILHWHDETLRSIFHGHAGEEVNRTGDGFFIAFPSPAAAAECAIAIQATLDQHRRAQGSSLQVRIGLHEAEATAVGGNYQGRGVHIAARIGAYAGADEILASAATAANLAGARTGAPRTASLKGISEPVDVVPIAWR